jgi:hypothetical protein
LLDETRIFTNTPWALARSARLFSTFDLNALLIKWVLEGVGPSAALGRDTTMLREILDKTAKRVINDLHMQPEVEAELLTTMGIVYRDLGE